MAEKEEKGKRKENKNEIKHETKHEAKKESKKAQEVKDDDFEHFDKRTSKYKKLLEKYKKRNRLVEIIIACIVILIVFFVACNKTFFKTNFTMNIDNSVVNIDLPRFSYYVKSDDDKIVFKTLRKSKNTRAFFEEYLSSDRFDIYYCAGSDIPYYYSSEGKFFILSIDVTKIFAIKTITVNYSTADYDSFCDTIVE